MSTLAIPDDLGPSRLPAATRSLLDRLGTALDAAIPRKRRGANLLIGTWNIALFGGLTRKWETARGDSPKRNLTDLCCLAEIVSRFDVCAMQETQRDLAALRALIRVLGPDWAFIVSDVTEGDPGHNERLCFVYDRRRVRASGLVGEIVIPYENLGVTGGGLDRQFARSPYAVSFSAGAQAFTLVTLHVLYGEGRTVPRRRQELQAFAEWLAERAGEPDDFNRNLMALGDFNIDRYGDDYWNAFASSGLGAPRELQDVPRNIAHRSSGKKFYDQIAWFTRGNREQLTLAYETAGSFAWTDHLVTDLTNPGKKAHISDHYPLWAEFSLR